MAKRENGLYIIQGEVNLLVTEMRRNSRWMSHGHQVHQSDEDQDTLNSGFSRLKGTLNSISDISEMSPNEFLDPFLDVIRSEDTTGPITGLALTSVNKFLAYGLIDLGCERAANAIENVADAVTHARFVGTDPGSDEVVLMKILHVLRTLLLTPSGSLLTNESVCEIMQSCFRICFEMRLSELLRKSAEHTLVDMVQLLFSRLPQFKEDTKWAANLRKLKMRPGGGVDPSRSGKIRKKSLKTRPRKSQPQHRQSDDASTITSDMPPPNPSGRPDYAASDVIAGKPMEPKETELTASIGVEVSQLEMSGDAEIVRDDMGCDASQYQSTPPDSLPLGHEVCAVSSDVVLMSTPVVTGLTIVDVQEGFKDVSVADDRPYNRTLDGSIPEKQQINESETVGDQYVWNSELCEKGPGVVADDTAVAPGGGGVTESGGGGLLEQAETGLTPVDLEFVNPHGVRFTATAQTSSEGGGSAGSTGPLVPYGLPCVRELLRFLVSLTNSVDGHNTDVMIQMGLSLLTVALESGADHIALFKSLLTLVRDDMCKNLFFLLKFDRLSLFAASIRVCFLLFESMRNQLKLQLEMYLTKLMDIIVSESSRILYEQREIALESIVQMLRIPGLVTELYLNYDCDLYCTNLFEDLTKLLSKNAFPVSGLFSTHLLSLDALLAVIDSIEQHCHHRLPRQPKSTTTDQHGPAVAKNDHEGTSQKATGLVMPPSSGCYVADQMIETVGEKDNDSIGGSMQDLRSASKIRMNRMKTSAHIPTDEELAAIKIKKKMYQTGTEYFNTKPSKGIAYLQEHGLLSNPLDAGEVVNFLKENPSLDKRMIGEFISVRKNSQILEAYQKSFNFEDTRIDESLRMYLETFRLPGEAPVISYILEHFAEHWHRMNGEPFANADVAFTLAYAVIILNVDQHNLNAKKQNVPMTSENFKRNLSKVNGGQDFDEDMLDEVFQAIKNEEIIMPAEQTGIVKENYMWKILLRRCVNRESDFIHAPTGAFDSDLFAIVWGPTVAALSFVFDKSSDENIIQTAISGYRKCALIAAHYSMSDVFDNLVISLCKFTTLLSFSESAESFPVIFGSNNKAQLAARTVFSLAQAHSGILHEGWKNILDCLLQLFRAKMLSEVLVKVDDFLDPEGRISLIRTETTTQQRTESGVLSSFYSYFTDTPQQRGPSPEEQEATKRAHRCIQECHVEQLIMESKFLQVDALQELLKALIYASRCPDSQESINGMQCDEDAATLFLEILITVILQNRDRIVAYWQMIQDHFYNLIVNANEHTFFVERAVVGLLRIAIKLLRREEIAQQMLGSLRILLLMKPEVIHSLSKHIAYGLHELVKTNAANIHSGQDWFTLFTLMEVVGAGTNPPPILQSHSGVDIPEVVSDAGAQSDSEVNVTGNQGMDDGTNRGYTSDSELYGTQNRHDNRSSPFPHDIRPPTSTHGSWLMINHDEVENCSQGHSVSASSSSVIPLNQFSIVLNEELKHHDLRSLLKCCETLAFLVRDAAHVTPHNFESCIHAIRMFVEASINRGIHLHQKQQHSTSGNKKSQRKQKQKDGHIKKSMSTLSHLVGKGDSDEEKEADSYQTIAVQLLDLMHTLHTRAGTIFNSWAQEEGEEEERWQQLQQRGSNEGLALDGTGIVVGTLWVICWCPILQGIARLCCDMRRHVRSQALNYLQKALLLHDLQTLSAIEWENCFNKVLFPLLSKLLDNVNSCDPSGIEETRIRASTLLCKVFLQHLSPLLSLSTFTALWLTILEYMDKYMHLERSDLLWEAIPESLKNMLLVMHTAGILHQGQTEESQLWRLTWDRIDTFLPNLKNEVFRPNDASDPDRRGLHDNSPSPPPVTPPRPASPPVVQTQQPQASSSAVSLQTSASSSSSTSQVNASSHHLAPETTSQTDESTLAVVPENSSLATSATPGVPQYFLHPPLPAIVNPSTVPGDVSRGSIMPLLLNPDILQQSTTIPVISPQLTTSSGN